MKEIITFLIAAGLAVSLGQEYGGGHALFVRTSPSGDGKRDTSRLAEFTRLRSIVEERKR